LLKFAKGYRCRSKNCFRIAIRRVQKAWQYTYRDRRRKTREWRKLWTMRLQAGVRINDPSKTEEEAPIEKPTVLNLPNKINNNRLNSTNCSHKFTSTDRDHCSNTRHPPTHGNSNNPFMTTTTPWVRTFLASCHRGVLLPTTCFQGLFP